MSPPSPALHRLVAKLAGEPVEAIEAILSALDAGERGTVEDLLFAYRGSRGGARRQAFNPGVEKPIRTLPGLSPWLVDRLRAGADIAARPRALDAIRLPGPWARAPRDSFHMTPNALLGLQRAARLAGDDPSADRGLRRQQPAADVGPWMGLREER